MAATPSVIIKKTFPYRGGTQEFSNRYHFNGGTPSDLAHWNTLADAIVAAEKPIFFNNVTIVQAVYYAAGSTTALGAKTYSVAGTLSFGSAAQPVPGDCAMCCSWPTTARSSKGHPVYLFSYWHGCFMDATGSSGDVLHSTQRTHMDTYANAWVTGFSDGVNTYVRAGPNGATGLTPSIAAYIGHRDFPR